jgi:hypothetical protein
MIVDGITSGQIKKWPNITKVTRLSLLFAFVLPSGTPNYD